MQRGGIRHWPFASNYLRDFEVVEERRDGVRLFPHTEQLPLLAQAIHREFEYGLTTRLASTDARADNWRKLQLREAAGAFCTIINAARPDHLHVHQYYTPEFVTQIAVVQHISETCPEGLAHRFRFFRGKEFLPDVHLAGKRVAFASHAIDRYAERATCTAYHPMAVFIYDFFESAKLPVCLSGDRPAVAFLTGDSMVAMPYRESADEYFLVTTLSPDQINTLTTPSPLPPLHLHYGPAYHPPAECYDRTGLIQLITNHWQKRSTPKDRREKERQVLEHMSYTGLVKQVQEVLRKNGHDEQSQMAFQDGIPGPFVLIGDVQR